MEADIDPIFGPMEKSASTKLPYVANPGSVPKILEKLKQAQTPERFTQDFLTTKLGFKSGNHKQFIPLAKKMGMLASDGRPTDIYKRFRNPSTSKVAMAAAVRTAYHELFGRNEFANDLEKEKLRGLIVEVTGLSTDNRVVQLVSQTFEALKKLSDFEADGHSDAKDENEDEDEDDGNGKDEERRSSKDRHSRRELNLSYVINLVLPKTDDQAVFNAIFKALNTHVLDSQ